jgi:hypothetical protein
MQWHSKTLRDVGTWRGFSPKFCDWLVERKLIGLHHDSIAFPVHDEGGRVSGAHCLHNRGEKKWGYIGGVKAAALVIGDPETAKEIHILESTWDGLAFLDRAGGYKSPDVSVIVTRGAQNFKTVRGRIPGGKRVYVWPQNDKPSAKGIVASEGWFKGIRQAIEAEFYRVQTPSQFADLNDWTRDGAIDADLVDAISNAQPVEPSAKTDEREPISRDDQIFNELLVKYESAVRTAAELESMAIIPRKPLLGKWMKEGDTGFVYGERGSGKTWLIDSIATHISTGKALFDWSVPEIADVMLVDGEMPGDDARDRIKGMAAGNTRFHILHHEVLFDLTGLAMNLTDPFVQRVITGWCVKKKAKLLILDNLSCFFSGVKENDADEWEKVLSWLLDLRRRRIAVLIVHHASRSGTMRGTSRREDAAFWVIKVEEVEGRDPNEKGARFHTTFTKQRNGDSPEWTREWTFKTEMDGQITIGCEEISFDEKVLRLIQDGIGSAKDIADELGCSRPTVCRSAQRLADRKFIEVQNRTYKPRGFMKKRNEAKSA